MSFTLFIWHMLLHAFNNNIVNAKSYSPLHFITNLINVVLSIISLQISKLFWNCKLG